MWSNTGAEGEMKGVVIEAYVQSLRMVWIVLTVLACAAFIATLIWTAEISLDRDLETEQGFRYESDGKKRKVTVDVEASSSNETFQTAKEGEKEARME